MPARDRPAASNSMLRPALLWSIAFQRNRTRGRGTPRASRSRPSVMRLSGSGACSHREEYVEPVEARPPVLRLAPAAVVDIEGGPERAAVARVVEEHVVEAAGDPSQPPQSIGRAQGRAGAAQGGAKLVQGVA